MNTLIPSYFPGLSADQLEKYNSLKDLYIRWNDKINVISRKDIGNFYERHVLHSLGIAKVIQFAPGTGIMDFGTGGGFPGIPLAIMFPDSEFMLVDSIGKKIKVVEAICNELNLTNVKTLNTRAESINKQFHFIVSRAVTALPEFVNWTQKMIKKESFNSLNNGIIYLKGGDLAQELNLVKKKFDIYNLDMYFEEEFFITKKAVHIY